MTVSLVYKRLYIYLSLTLFSLFHHNKGWRVKKGVFLLGSGTFVHCSHAVSGVWNLQYAVLSVSCQLYSDQDDSSGIIIVWFLLTNLEI